MSYKTIHLDEVVSTNSFLAESGTTSAVSSPSDSDSPLSLVVVADYQTGGRGCGQNKWESERGMNLLFSVLLHPHDLPANRQFRISMAVSVALREMLSQYASGFTVKWPNDIYWHDCKICGILIENRLLGMHIRDSIVGIGLNVNQQEFHSDAPNPVSLRQILGHDVSRDDLLHDFLSRLDETMLRHSLFADYVDSLYRRGVLARYANGHGTFMATLVGITDDGHLKLVDSDGNQRIYAFKEVSFVI